jgi:glycosyltransferase involved in cell wall biosynthesis
MKKIVFLGYDVNLGLTFYMVDWIETLNRLSNDRLKITVVTLNRSQYPGLLENLKKISVTSIFIDNNEDLEKLNIFQETDLVHCHGTRHALTVQKIRKRYNLSFKIIVTMHSFRHGYWYRPIFTNIVSTLCLNHVDMVHFVSQSSINEFLSCNFAFNRNSDTAVFPLGCRTDRFISSISIQHLNFYNKIAGTEKNIIYLADLIPRKNHIWLIKTLKDLLIEEDARLWLFGQSSQETRIKKFIKANNLDNYVYLPGRVDGKYIPAILKEMDVAICISKSETMGYNILEPMFAGIPVVTFDVGIASSVIRDFVTGFIIKDKSDSRNFKRAIKFILRNKNSAAQMGKNGKLFAEQWLSWEVTARNCLDLYLSMSF